MEQIAKDAWTTTPRYSDSAKEERKNTVGFQKMINVESWHQLGLHFDLDSFYHFKKTKKKTFQNEPSDTGKTLYIFFNYKKCFSIAETFILLQTAT